MTEKNPSQKATDSSDKKSEQGLPSLSATFSKDSVDTKSPTKDKTNKDTVSKAAEAKAAAVQTNEQDASKTKSSASSANKSSSNSSNKPNATNTRNTTRNATTTPKQKISKTAILALLIALGAGAGVGGLFVFQQQAQQELIAQINAQTTQSLNDAQQQAKEQQSNQQAQFAQQLDQTVKSVRDQSEERLEAIEQQLSLLAQSEPSDWVLHEVEYLVRVAGRSLWLEDDKTAAIGLLTEADYRLAELNNPEYLGIRKLLHQDIEKLKLVPSVNTENVVLKLMGMNKQVSQLVLNYQPQFEREEETSFELTDDVADWKENLKRSWDEFAKTYLKISVHRGSVEPLITPQYQQHLYQNLGLKMQVAQWAATQGDETLYLATLEDIQAWLTEYFDLENATNALFAENIQLLKSELITVQYPEQLATLNAIRAAIDTQSPVPALPEEPAQQTPEADGQIHSMPNALPDSPVQPGEEQLPQNQDSSPEPEVIDQQTNEGIL